MQWNLRELQFFVAAAETGSFTAAASRLHVSQAAVSRTISAFERAVGERLFHRLPAGCELTATGQRLISSARRVLAEAQRFEGVLQSQRSSLRLGYAYGALGRHTADLHRMWRQENPEIDLQLSRHNSSTSGLMQGSCDVAIVRMPVDEKAFESVVVGLEQRVAVFAVDDVWAERSEIHIADFLDRTVIANSEIGTTTAALWAAYERRPEMIETGGEVDTWLDAIAAGRGVSATTEATEFHHPRSGLTFRPMAEAPRIPVALAWWRESNPPGLHGLIDLITRLYHP